MSIEHLTAQSQEYYNNAIEAMKKNDYYHIVVNLRNAADCQRKLAEISSDVVAKYQHFKYAQSYMESARKWEENHPEAFVATSLYDEKR